MPELPDITIYVEALDRRLRAARLDRVRLNSPFLLRTADPAIALAGGRRVLSVSRLGKRVVIGLEDDYWLVLHLMIAGRLHWFEPDRKVPAKAPLALFEFDTGTLTLTEAGTKRRAALHFLHGKAALATHHRPGLEPLEATRDEFAGALRRENHTLKRALTDPRLISGIGNAYSDEILHAARLSPVALTSRISDGDVARLHAAVRATLAGWTTRLRELAGDAFPEHVTAFREDMAVHGRYGKPCPACKTAVQRIRYASNETNYCPRCQTDGRILADRSLSRLLKDDWPTTIDELEREALEQR
ncbi:MAG TPA: DNA-formamidopyrimidine glycosylase family protein [Steroidobacteraceae bacterium]|nr:DNA-formamidopyrimidine glycosylase family protein [Steroidobacteraceae bacterium]